jgi:hypothetical protein
MKRSSALAVLLLAAAVTAQAQTKKELVTKLVQLHQQGIEQIGRVIAGQTSQEMLQAAGQALPNVAANKREAVGKEIQADVKKFYDEVEPLLKKRAVELAPAIVGPMYEEKFSEDELKTLIAWLESPVSRKYAEVGPAQSDALAQKLVADTRATIEPKIKALETTVAKRLGVPTAPPPAAPAASAPKKK